MGVTMIGVIGKERQLTYTKQIGDGRRCGVDGSSHRGVSVEFLSDELRVLNEGICHSRFITSRLPYSIRAFKPGSSKDGGLLGQAESNALKYAFSLALASSCE